MNGRQRLSPIVYLNKMGNSQVVLPTNERVDVVAAGESGFNVSMILSRRSRCSTLPSMENRLLKSASRLKPAIKLRDALSAVKILGGFTGSPG